MKAVDTHCHLQMKQFDADREQVIAEALECLEWLVLIGDGIENCRNTLPLLRPRVYGAVGFHPYQASDYDDDAEQALEAFAAAPGIVALGEMGLDYYNEFSPRAAQRPCFERQLALAARLGLPVVIHCRAADDDTHAILRDHVPRLPACIMHCFGGTPAFAEQCLALGCFISFAGNVTFPKAEALRDAARRVPTDRLLVETDAPYLAPQPVRGKRCEPRHVVHTLEFLADLLAIPRNALGDQVIANACRAFNITPPPESAD